MLPADDEAPRKVDPAHWRRISACLDEALDLDAEPRASWLARLRQTEPPLADEVAALLAEHDAALAEVFLDGVVAMPAPTGPAASLQGRHLGAYTLQDLIGQGGMGSVWRALRSDGQYDAFVAIKLLNTALIGTAGLARFKREGSILARLQHPHIAHLLDAGVSDDGQPYLVLELVEGEPIDAYCARCRLGVEQRLVLFLDALGAVAHAHTHLVVHRDLKPSNVLVMSDGQVKLLDFGIAKLLEDDGGAGTLTQDGTRALTPQYAAPEQLQGGPITTATDVYALGVMLYQLLAGQHPTGGDHGSAAQIILATLHTEPARMSDLSAVTRACDADIESIAGERATSVAGLQRQLRGDLDNIVARALSKPAAERYPSVAALADDLRRHLAHEPVSARADSLGYRLAKFVRRRRGFVAAGGLAVLAVAAGIVGTVTQALRAEAETVKAQQERDNALRQLTYAESGQQFISYLLDEGSSRPFSTPELLARGEVLVQQQFASDPAQRARLELLIAARYSQAEETNRAMTLMLRARDSARNVADLSLQARIECQLAQLHISAGSFETVRRLLDAAIERLRAAPDTDRATLAACLYASSEARGYGGDPTGAVADARAALEILGTPRADQRLLAILIRTTIADARGDLGELATAVAEYRQVIDELQAMGRGRTRQTATIHSNLGRLLAMAGQPLSALEAYERALDVARGFGGAEPDETLQGNHAKMLIELGRPGDAMPLFEHALTVSKSRGNRRADASLALQGAPAWCALQELARCAELLSLARTGLFAILPAGHSALATLEMAQGQLALAQTDLLGARTRLQSAVAAFDAAADKNPSRIRALSLLARTEAQLGELDAAHEHSARAVAQARRAMVGFAHSQWLGNALLAQAIVQQARGEAAAAQASAQAALVELQATVGDAAPATVEARRLLAAS